MNAQLGACFQPRPDRGSGLVGVTQREALLGRGRSTPTDRLGPKGRSGSGLVPPGSPTFSVPNAPGVGVNPFCVARPAVVRRLRRALGLAGADHLPLAYHLHVTVRATRVRALRCLSHRPILPVRPTYRDRTSTARGRAQCRRPTEPKTYGSASGTLRGAGGTVSGDARDPAPVTPEQGMTRGRFDD